MTARSRERRARRLGEHGAAAEREHGGSARRAGRATISSSSSRNAASPSLEELRDRRAGAPLDLARRRRRTAGRAAPRPRAPTVDFPAPMKPMSARCRSSARCQSIRSRYARHARDEVAERVAAELLARGARELERDGGLGDDGERLDGGDVAALDERLGRLAGLEVDRARAAASASAAASSPRGRRSPRRSRRRPRSRPRGSSRGGAPLVAADLVVRLASRAARRARSRRRSRRPSPPGCPSAPRRAARRAGPPSSRTSRARRRRRARAPRRRRRACRGRRAPRRSARLELVRVERREPATSIPISREQRLRDRAGGDEDGGVPRARALERVAHVVEPVLQHAGEVGVAGPRQRHRLRALARPARPRAATGSSPTSSSCGRGCGRRARAACRACARAGARRAPRPRPSRSAGAGCGRSPAGGGAGRRRSRRGRATSPAGSPVTIATSAGPCDSPAVTSSRGHGAKPTAARMTSSGAGTPVQRSNEAAPCADEHLEARRRRSRRRRARPAPSPCSGYGRSTSVCPARQLEEQLVAHRGRVDDEVGVCDLRRPVAPPGEDRRLGSAARTARAPRRRRRRSPAARTAASSSDRGVGARAQDAAVAERRACSPTRRRLVRAARGGRGLVRHRHVRARETERHEPADRRLDRPSRRTSTATYAQSSPRAAKAAFCIRGESESRDRVAEQPTSRVALLAPIYIAMRVGVRFGTPRRSP